MRVDFLTIFPEMFWPALNSGVIGRAVDSGLLDVRVHQLRDYTADKHRKVDDKPYGGGPGMVFRPEPVVIAVEAVRAPGGRVLVMSPQGRPLNDVLARELALESQLVIIAGRYEGYDERIITLTGAEEVSIGDFVLSGGELAALVVVDAAARFLPGVLGSDESALADSFGAGLLEGPQYTRPEVFRGIRVPEVLLSGDHEHVRQWRLEQARLRTLERRRDLLNGGLTAGNDGKE
ncbi:MAG: tRNA (guanosine(37)-N1)-methyltransferase TrmD [Planctomycetes bacterium]|nr:tRNA (guanosine(37)-N1)-methyltransferase TrmD [Planctomycetota bacterium]